MGRQFDNGELAWAEMLWLPSCSWVVTIRRLYFGCERIVRERHFLHQFTSKIETMSRDTKLGKEEITRDIPNVGEEVRRI